MSVAALGIDERHPAPSSLAQSHIPWPSPRLAWLAVGLLAAGAIVSQLDRMIINLLVKPIKTDFALSDTQFGALQGIAFGLFYTFMTIPIGRLSDRYQRRTVIGLGIALFSLFSLATGFSKSYWQLFLARIGVGVGEASVFPAGFSIISDYFPPEKLGRAISIFTMSSMIGTAIAYIFGGALIGWLDGLAISAPEMLHGLKPWQLAFIAVSIPGLLLAPALLMLREPVRRGLAAGAGAQLPIRAVLRVIADRGRFLTLMFAGFSMVTLVSYSLTIWTPALFMRVHGWGPAQIGFWFGIIFLTCATSGSFFAGWLVDRFGAKGATDAPLKVAAFGFIGCGLFGGLAPLMPTPTLALLLLAPTMFLSAMPYPCAATALQLIIPNQARSQVGALYLTFINLVGLGVGPILIGVFIDHMFSQPSDVRYSLAIVVACAAPVMCLLVLLACKPYRALRA